MAEKSIVRVSKNKDNPYVMMNKEFLSDSKLSWRAKGMLSYLLSKPDNWQVNPNDLIKKSKDGRDAVYACLNELIEFGYIQRNKIRNDKGHFSHIEYLVFEVSKTSMDTKISPFTDIPYTVKPHLVKSNLVNPETDTPISDNPDNNKNLDLGFNEFDLNNVFNNNQILVSNDSINQSNLKNKSERLTDDLISIFEKCNLYLYGNKEQTFIKNALRDMYLTENFSKSLNISIKIVREKLSYINVQHFDVAIDNYKNAVLRSQREGTKITAPMKYFSKCIWNAIIDAELNDSGIFDDVFTDD